MKWIITTQLPDSPPPQQGASDLISGQTGLFVYRFYLHIIPSHINIIFFNHGDATVSYIVLRLMNTMVTCKNHMDQVQR